MHNCVREFRSQARQYGRDCEGTCRWALESNPGLCASQPHVSHYKSNATHMATLFGRAPLGASCSQTDRWSWPPRGVPAQRPRAERPDSRCTCSNAAAHTCRQRPPTTAQAPCCGSVCQQEGGPRRHAHRLVCCSAAGAAAPKETHIGFLGAGIMGTPMVIRPHPSSVRGTTRCHTDTA